MLNKKKESNKFKRVFAFSLLLVFMFFLVNLLFSLMDNKDTILPENATIYRKIYGQAVIIKDETVYYSNETSDLDIKINEGERVPVGTEVISSTSTSISSDLQLKLTEIEEKINSLSTKNVSLLDNNEVDDFNKKDLIESIQKELSYGQYFDINIFKTDLLNINNSEYSTNTNENLLNRSIKALENQRQSILEQISNNKYTYTTKDAGIVSYNNDGYESVFLPAEFDNYIYENIEIEDNIQINTNSDSGTIKAVAGKPVFKIINNFEWYMAIKIENKNDIEKYHILDTLSIELEDNSIINGVLTHINISGDHAVIILRFNDHLHTDFNKRFTDINIIIYKKDCYKIPTSVIIEKDGTKGVLIEEVNGIVKYRQISILGEDGMYTYIDKGDGNGYIKVDNSDNPIRTILLYDEIFTDPNNVKEGDILK